MQRPTGDPGKEAADENPEENAGDGVEKRSTGAVGESPETADKAGGTPAEKDGTPGQS